MNKRISPSSVTACIRSFSRSSNSPRYFAPASIPARSTENTFLLNSCSGTFPAAINCASPSAIALFPTPGSPISTGLFFERRHSTCTSFSISFSLPITGSSLPFLARSVKSTPNRINFSSANRLSPESFAAPPFFVPTESFPTSPNASVPSSRPLNAVPPKR